MAYHTLYPWRKNPRLVTIQYKDHISESDLTASLENLLDLMEQSLVPMHTVFDFTDAHQLSDRMLDIFMHSGISTHPNRGIWIIVNGNEFVCFVITIIGQKANMRIDYVDSCDEAWDIFNEMGIC